MKHRLLVLTLAFCVAVAIIEMPASSHLVCRLTGRAMSVAAIRSGGLLCCGVKGCTHPAVRSGSAERDAISSQPCCVLRMAAGKTPAPAATSPFAPAFVAWMPARPQNAPLPRVVEAVSLPPVRSAVPRAPPRTIHAPRSPPAFS